MTDKLIPILDSYYADTLRTMAETGGLKVKTDAGKSLPKSKIIVLMQREFFTCERISASAQKLNDQEKIVLNRILWHGGLISLRILKRELLAEKIIKPTPAPKPKGYYDRESYIGERTRKGSKILEDILARLTYFGLVFNYLPNTRVGQSYKYKWSPAGLSFVPQVIRDCLPTPTPPVIKKKQIPTQIYGNNPNTFLRNLYLYWDFVRRTPVKLLKSGFVGKRDLIALERTLLYSEKEISAIKREDDAPMLLLFRQLLQHLKLLRQNGTQLTIAEEKTDAESSFWAQSTVSQLSRLFEMWLIQIPKSAQLFGETRLRSDFQHACKVLIQILKKNALDDWFSVDDFWRAVQTNDTNFVFPHRLELESHQSGAYGIYVNDRYYYETQDQLLETCDKIELTFVHYFLSQMMFVLGMVDVGTFPDEKLPSVYRLTAYGRSILKIPTSSDAPTSETGKVILQPNFQILAMGPVSLSVLAKLDLFADRQKVDISAFEYQITRQSIYRAQQADIAVDTVLQWLADFTEQPVPQNVYRSLVEWGEHHRRIVFRTDVSLLQTADAELLQQLTDTPKLNQHIARTITPNIALLKNKQDFALLKKLRSENILATLGNDRPESIDHSILFHADGAIDLIHHAPDLHLRGRLSRYADEDATGQWRLTAESVRRSTGNKAKVTSVLEDMRRLHRGTLPPELVSQVKAWGGYYGDVSIEKLTLIEFQDAETMSELMAHPELKGLLSPFAADKRALAIVAAKKLTHVKKVLADLSISVKKTTAKK